MRRRAVVLGVPLGLAALVGCGPEGERAVPPDPTEPGSSVGPSVGSSAVPVENPEPVLVGERAEVVAYTEVNVPLEMTPMIVVDPGWTSAPFELDGIFLAHRVHEDHLQYVAVHQDGTVLWRADRPATCTDMVLTRGTQGEPVAVLSDIAAGGEAGTDAGGEARTLTGYHLRTAEKLWGPVPAVGAQAALGLVREAGDGRRLALSGGTGLPLLDEADLAGGRILGEHLGRVLRTEGEELVAVGPDGEVRWRAAPPAGVVADAAEVLGAVDPSTSFAAIGDAQGAGAVLDLVDGRTVAEDARAVARDHVLEITVVASGTTVRGLDDAGTEQWRHEDPEPLVLISAGERLAYAVRRQEGTLVVLDTGQGRMVQPFDADSSLPLAMPELFSARTAAAVRVQERRLLVTTEFDEDYGRRG